MRKRAENPFFPAYQIARTSGRPADASRTSHCHPCLALRTRCGYVSDVLFTLGLGAWLCHLAECDADTSLARQVRVFDRVREVVAAVLSLHLGGLTRWVKFSLRRFGRHLPTCDPTKQSVVPDFAEMVSATCSKRLLVRQADVVKRASPV